MEKKTSNKELQGTRRRIRIAAEMERNLIALVDKERKGKCSRAAIIRMALIDRYQKKPRPLA